MLTNFNIRLVVIPVLASVPLIVHGLIKRSSRRRLVDRVRSTLLQAIQRIAKNPRWDRERACVILSGGLDSCIVTEVGGSTLGLSGAFTVAVDAGARDAAWAAAAATTAGLTGGRHVLLRPSCDELLAAELETCVRVLKTFDGMELRNAMAVSAALRAAAAAGFTCAVTGDGADELFGGYSFTHGMPPAAWKAHQCNMAAQMRFCAPRLGEHFGMFVTSPFTDPEVVSLAVTECRKEDCVTPMEQVRRLVKPRQQSQLSSQQSPQPPPMQQQQQQQLLRPPHPQEAAGQGTAPLLTMCGGITGMEAWPPAAMVGKAPLRAAWPGVTAAWRPKEPIEVGSGTTVLGRTFFDGRMSASEFEAVQLHAREQDGVLLRDREHAVYYTCFRRVFPGGAVPGLPRHGSDPCPACSYQLSHAAATFCITCGHWDPALAQRQREPCGTPA